VNTTLHRAVAGLAPVVLVALAACGSSGSDDYQAAVDAAVAKEDQARALGVDSPCVEVAQCGVLEFSPVASCGSWSYKPYSRVSATAAAASAAAAEQRELASRAVSLGPPSDTACPAVVTPRPPTLSCAANHCLGS
jgi:hypothetical protein